ncbi:MAG TPA: DUF664 domain-containing protein [Acidimicrobiales bacterium]|nr:DUF664 domain-containing protein [Acidimicrobiales bacterium]
MTDDAPPFVVPALDLDERETLLAFLDWKRANVLQAARELTDEQCRWTPSNGLLPVGGIINHLTHVEGRWIDGKYLCVDLPPADPATEFMTTRPLAELVADYNERRRRTNEVVRAAPDLDVACPGGARPNPQLTLRWVLYHLLEETAQHAGHAEATRELLDGRRTGD